MNHNRNFRIETIVIFISYLVGAMVFLSIVKDIGSLYSIVFCLLFAISLYFDYRRSFRIPRWLLTTLSLAIVILALYRLNMEELITQMMETLLTLLAIKLLEEKKVRDYLQIYAITLLLLSGSGLLSLNIAFFVFYLVIIFTLTIAAILRLLHSGQRPGPATGHDCQDSYKIPDYSHPRHTPNLCNVCHTPKNSIPVA